MITTTPDLTRITTDIWSTVLGIEVQPGPGVPEGTPTLTAVVSITGDWEGAVQIQCSAALARHAAATMFMMETDELTDEEVYDTVGELANMTGGNVKSALQGTCQLSLPTVTAGTDYRQSTPGAHVAEAIAFEAAGEPLVITCIERS